MLCLEYEMQTMTAKKKNKKIEKLLFAVGKKGKLKLWMAEFNNNSALFWFFTVWKIICCLFSLLVLINILVF